MPKPNGSTAGEKPEQSAVQGGYIFILRLPWWITITRMGTRREYWMRRGLPFGTRECKLVLEGSKPPHAECSWQRSILGDNRSTPFPAFRFTQTSLRFDLRRTIFFRESGHDCENFTSGSSSQPKSVATTVKSRRAVAMRGERIGFGWLGHAVGPNRTRIPAPLRPARCRTLPGSSGWWTICK